VDAVEVEEVEPRRRDAGEQEGGYVGSVEVRDERADGIGRVVTTDRTAGKSEAVDDAVRADDGARDGAGRGGIGEGDAERPAPGVNRP
jgi:hypothetical protein